MADDPLHNVYSFVERAYVRLQAGDILIRCLEEGSVTPIHQMVEGMVLAGPRSLDNLREILAEADHRKGQVQDDLSQVFSKLINNLKSYGMILPESMTPFGLLETGSAQFLDSLRGQGIEESAQVACMQLIYDNRDLMTTLVVHIELLDEIETYLQDWLWGLAYQSARQEENHSL